MKKNAIRLFQIIYTPIYIIMLLGIAYSLISYLFGELKYILIIAAFFITISVIGLLIEDHRKGKL